MTSTIGIPTTRVSDQFIRQRLLQQVQYDQKELLRVQMQLSTGRRFELPSEDPIAASRVMSLQRLLEQKLQMRRNLETSQSYLNANDVALGQVSNLMADVRGLALGAMGTTSTDAQRTAAAEQVHQALQQLIDTGNQKFRGRYLFAGSTTLVSPFEGMGDGYVEYFGNEQHLLSYSDTDLLSQTNFTGNDVFGAISEAVRGTADLTPALRFDAQLTSLRGGTGISRGSIIISNGSISCTVDLSQAETIGDVAALIKNNSAGIGLDVDVTPTGLTLQLQSATGNLSVREVGGGTTAAELGILDEAGAGTDPLVGEALDPAVTGETPLVDLLGTRACATLRFPVPDNDIIIQADACGEDLNGTKIRLVDDPTVSAGSETVEYDDVAKEIVVHIDEGRTLAQDVVDAINHYHDDLDALPFTARLDSLDGGGAPGQGQVIETPAGEWAATTAGGNGVNFDKDSGLEIVNGGKTYTISLASATTVEDLLNLLNSSEAGVLAEINADGTHLDLRSRISGCDFAIGENGGLTATQLGLRTFTGETLLSDLNFGLGVGRALEDGVDFVITRADGVELQITLGDVTTVQGVLDLVNKNTANPPRAVGEDPWLVARFTEDGNGIELVDESVGTGSLTVTKGQTSRAAIDLGLIPDGETSSSASAGIPQVVTGTDVNPLETKGLFTALVRLEKALRASDEAEIERAIGILDEQVGQLDLARAELGAKQQGLDVLSSRLDSEEVELQTVLSDEYDADFTEAASEYAAWVAALEAALQTTAQIYSMTLLDYL